MRRGLAIFFLCISCLLLAIVSILYHLKNIGDSYGEEEKINFFLSKIPIEDLFVDEQGVALESIVAIKEEFVRVGIPKEVVDAISNTEVVKQKISRAIVKKVERFLLEEENEPLSLSSDAILAFAKENGREIVNELQRNHIPKSEQLTEEKQKEILLKMEVVVPQIEEEIRKVLPILEKKLLDSEQYPKIEKIKIGFEKMSQVSRIFYQKSFSIILLITGMVCIGVIFLLCHSPYRYLKFFGFSCFISAFFFFCCILVLSKIKQYIGKLPFLLQDFSTAFIEDVHTVFGNLFGVYLFLFFSFVILNMIIHKILDRRVEKKLDRI